MSIFRSDVMTTTVSERKNQKQTAMKSLQTKHEGFCDGCVIVKNH